MNRHIAVVDLGYGDAGKGAVVDRICANTPITAVIRANGGSQAQHNVMTDDGRHHTFAQFGSGTFHGVPTFLSEFMMVEPFSLQNESYHLASLGVEHPLSMVQISEDALLTTPLHWELNRWAERKRGADAHGTTGRGIGPTAEFALLAPGVAPRMRDLHNLTQLGVKLTKLNEWVAVLTGNEVNFHHTQLAALKTHYRDLAAELTIVPNGKLHDLLNSGRCVFEGAQGVLLDGDYGFHPHTTWSYTTDRNPRTICAWYQQKQPYILGVTRAYTTRHGAGPMVTHDPTLNLPELHNNDSGYAGTWRAGHFDAVALNYAKSMCELVDGLYVTHLDSADAEPALEVCTAYDNPYLFNIQACNPVDKAARVLITDLLNECTPILTPRPEVSWADSISLLLDLRLVGEGRGPATGDGKFLMDIENLRMVDEE